MQVTGDRDSFDLVVPPAHLARNDFAVLADAHGMTLGITVLDINRGGKGMHGFFVDFPETIVQALVLFRFPFDFAQQVMAVDSHRDVTS